MTLGRGDVLVIVRGSGTIVNPRTVDACCAGELESVTSIEILLLVEGMFGMPLMIPVVGSNVKALGSPDTLQVRGVLPPVAVSVTGP